MRPSQDDEQLWQTRAACVDMMKQEGKGKTWARQGKACREASQGMGFKAGGMEGGEEKVTVR